MLTFFTENRSLAFLIGVAAAAAQTSQTTQKILPAGRLQSISVMDPKEKDALTRLLAAKPTAAVTYFEFLLAHDKFSSFDAFLDHYRKNAKHSQCQENWAIPQIAVHCDNCARDRNACFCVKCFVNSNHEGHAVVVRPETCGSCDCGNTSFWKPEGFCAEHSSGAQEPTTLPEFHKVFEEIVGMIFLYAAQKPENKEDHDKNVWFLMKWVAQFLELGDVFGDMITTGMLEHADLQKMFVAMAYLGASPGRVLFDIWGALCNNTRFTTRGGLAFFKAEKEIRDLYFERIEKGQPLGGLDPLLQFAFHFYALGPICYAIEQGFDLVSWLVDVLRAHCVKGLVMSGVRERNLFGTHVLELAALPRRIADAEGIDSQSLIQQMADKMVAATLDLDDKLMCSPDQIVPSPYANCVGAWFACVDLFHELPPTVKYDPTNIFRLSVQRWKDKMAEVRHFGFVQNETIVLVQHSDILVHELLAVAGGTRDLVAKLCAENGISIDTFLLGSASNVLAIHAVRILMQMHIVSQRNQGLAHFCSVNTMVGSTNSARTYHTILQRIFGLAEDKERVIRLFAELFGAFDESVFENDVEVKSMRFEFIHAVSSYIANRSLHHLQDIHDDKNREIIVWNLLQGPRTIGELQEQARWFYDRSALKRILSDVANPVKSKSGQTQYKLKGDEVWNPLTVVYKVSDAQTAMAEWMKHNPDKLLPFKPLEPEVCGYTLSDVLGTNTVRAMQYQILSEWVTKTPKACEPSVQVVLGDLLMGSQVDDRDGKPDESIIEAQSFTELVEHLPKGIPFRSFIHQKVKFAGREVASIVDMVAAYGKVGHDVLVRLNVRSQEVSGSAESDDAQTKRERARLMRMNVLQDMQAKRNLFLDADTRAVSEESTETQDDGDTCVICSRSRSVGAIGYPVMCWKSRLPLRFDSRLDGSHPAEPVLQFHLCPHTMHISCVHEKPFSCPMDRFTRNNILPILPDVTETLDSVQRESVDQFVKDMRPQLSEPKRSKELLIASLASLIVVYDVRLRTTPSALDAPKHELLPPALFRVIWHYARGSGAEDADPLESSQRTPFRTYMTRLIMSENPKEESEKFARQAIEEMAGQDEEELYVLLRRIRLTEHFCLGKEVECYGSLIDWDESLSPAAFSSLVKFREEEYRLPGFSLCELPKRYLDFAKDPYNYPVWQALERRLLSLTDGALITQSPNDQTVLTTLPSYAEDHEDEPLFFMCMGIRGSATISVLLSYHKVAEMMPIYVDEFGDPDVGMQRGQLLYLSEQNCAKVADMIISGDFMELRDTDE